MSGEQFQAPVHSFVKPTPLPVSWSEAKIGRLRSQIERSKPGDREHTFLTASLAAAEGRTEIVDGLLMGLVSQYAHLYPADDYTFQNLVGTSLLCQQFDLTARFIHDRFGCRWIERLAVDHSDTLGGPVVRWVCNEAYGMEFHFSVWLFKDDRTLENLLYWIRSLPLWFYYSQSRARSPGEVMINLFDVGVIPGLSFCDNRPDFFLIPDPMFLGSTAYAQFKDNHDRVAIPWEQRKSVALWRGTTTGRVPGTNWQDLPRIRLCLLAQSSACEGLLDAGLTGVSESLKRHHDDINRLGLFKGYIPSFEFATYKYQIDIDGHTNAWSGLMQKLYTGSTVLKIASSSGFRQWYYERLLPWRNFVPVSAEMEDLLEKIRWLTDHDSVARQIGIRGRELVISMSLEAELAEGLESVRIGMMYQPHTRFDHRPKPP